METGGGEASQGNKTYQCPQDLELLSYSSPLCSQKWKEGRCYFKYCFCDRKLYF